LFVIPPSLGPFGLRPYPAPSERWHVSCFTPPRDRGPLAIVSPATVPPGRPDPMLQAVDPSGAGRGPGEPSGSLATMHPAGEQWPPVNPVDRGSAGHGAREPRGWGINPAGSRDREKLASASIV